jgi:hypothetical protein
LQLAEILFQLTDLLLTRSEAPPETQAGPRNAAAAAASAATCATVVVVVMLTMPTAAFPAVTMSVPVPVALAMMMARMLALPGFFTVAVMAVVFLVLIHFSHLPSVLR